MLLKTSAKFVGLHSTETVLTIFVTHIQLVLFFVAVLTALLGTKAKCTQTSVCIHIDFL